MLRRAQRLASSFRPAKEPGDFHLDAFGRIPVVHQGRIKPMDTLARTSLMVLSNKQTMWLQGDHGTAVRGHWMKMPHSAPVERVPASVAWERFAIDPRPGPRPIEEIRGGERLDGAAVLADAATTTDDGVAFAEAGVADFLGTRTALIDITRGVLLRSRIT